MMSESVQNPDTACPAPSLSIQSIVERVLASAGDIRETSHWLTEEIRKQTGARLVVLVKCALAFGHEGQPVVAVNPLKLRDVCTSPSFRQLTALADELDASAGVDTSKDQGPLVEVLTAMGFERSLLLPLLAGTARSGALLALGLPAATDLEALRSTLGPLTRALALVLHNAYLMHEMESVLQSRTQELKASQANYERLVEGMRDGVAVFGLDGLVTYVNDSLCQMLCRSRDDLQRHPIADFLDPEGVKAFESWNIQPPGASARPIQVSWALPDGSVLTTTVTNQLLRDRAGQVQGTFIVVKDITEQLRAEAEKQRLERQIQQAQRLESLGVLAGGVAHDFNNLLAAILGFANLSLIELPADSPARENLVAIEKASLRAADLCKQMLAYSGKGQFVIRSIDLTQAVGEVLRILEASVSKKVRLECRLAHQLPLMEGDSSQIHQIVMNLVTNASEAMGEGEGVITITTGSMTCDATYLAGTQLGDSVTPGEYVYLEVSDTGCGMAPETMGKIFDPFFSTKFTGRGLGLAAVFGIVRGHHGTLKVTSDPGKGSTFTALFPARPQLARPEAPGPRPATVSDKPATASGTVLLVDDEELVRSMGRTMLKRLGYQVLLASNGAEALKIFAEHGPEIACVILDLTMPRMDGVETYRELLKIRSDLPVIITSGYDEGEITHRFVDLGVAAFLQKPFDVKRFASTIAAAIQRHS